MTIDLFNKLTRQETLHPVYATRNESQIQTENSEGTEAQTQYPSKVKPGYGNSNDGISNWTP